MQTCSLCEANIPHLDIHCERLTDAQRKRAHERQDAFFKNVLCGTDDCLACTGETCFKCGAGCWDSTVRNCTHDVSERHETTLFSLETLSDAGVFGLERELRS